MNEFSCDWASALLETMYHSEFDEGFGKLCTQCEEDAKEKCIGLYRCTDCFQSPILCKACAIRTHKWNPFHRLQMWTGTHLERKTLHDLGFVLNLGHYGDPCPKASLSSELVVLHTNGIQKATVTYCECKSSVSVKDRPLQLCYQGLYPATFKRTQTVFSITLLKQYHHLTLQSKITAHDFIISLRRLSSNGFASDSKDRYREFMTAHRQYSFLRTLRWNHQPVKEQKRVGSLAVRCPACPQPEINMDPNWRKSCKDLW